MFFHFFLWGLVFSQSFSLRFSLLSFSWFYFLFLRLFVKLPLFHFFCLFCIPWILFLVDPVLLLCLALSRLISPFSSFHVCLVFSCLVFPFIFCFLPYGILHDIALPPEPSNVPSVGQLALAYSSRPSCPAIMFSRCLSCMFVASRVGATKFGTACHIAEQLTNRGKVEGIANPWM